MMRRILPSVPLCLLLVVGGARAAAPKVGDKVWAQWRPNAWYHGKLTKAVGAGFHVVFDDGDEADVVASLIAVDDKPPKAQAKVGRRVLAKWTDGRFYPALITGEAAGKYDVRFEDGATGTVGLDGMRLIALKVVAARTPKAGDKVWAQWKPNAWFHGTVDRAGTAGLHINFDDGDKAEVAACLVVHDRAPKKADVKLGSRVLAKYTDGKFYSGTVVKTGATFQVRFDDGASGDVGLDDLRLLNE